MNTENKTIQRGQNYSLLELESMKPTPSGHSLFPLTRGILADSRHRKYSQSEEIFIKNCHAYTKHLINPD